MRAYRPVLGTESNGQDNEEFEHDYNDLEGMIAKVEIGKNTEVVKIAVNETAGSSNLSTLTNRLGMMRTCVYECDLPWPINLSSTSGSSSSLSAL